MVASFASGDCATSSRRGIMGEIALIEPTDLTLELTGF